MKREVKVVCCVCLVASSIVGRAQEWAGTVAPGEVAKAAVVESVGWQVSNWRCEESSAPGEATFTLSGDALSDISIIAYDVPEIFFGSAEDGELRPLPDTDAPSVRLKVRPLPAGVPCAALQAALPLRLVSSSGKGAYSATLPYVGTLPFRAVNVAPDAMIVVSSQDKPSQGFQPRGWVNRPETLVSGFVDGRDNFRFLPREAPLTVEEPEWVTLAWDTPRDIRMVGVMCGTGESCGQPLVEFYVGDGDPRFASGAKGWKVMTGTWTKPGAFRASIWLDFGMNVSMRGLRLRVFGEGIKQPGLGQIIALSDLKDAEAPQVAERHKGRIPITFTIPDAGKVTIQIRDAQGGVVANPVTGQSFDGGTHTAYWDLTDVVGAPVIAPGDYTWHGLYVPGLKVEYKYSYYPFPLVQVPWQTPDRKGGWLADHEVPRTICRHDDTMWIGAFAEAGDSIVHLDADMNRIWGIDRLWVAIPGEICSDGDFYYGVCEGGWIGDNQVILQVHKTTHRDRKIFQREMGRKDNPQRTDGVTGFQVVDTLAFLSFAATNKILVYDLQKGMEGPWRGFGWDHAYKQFEDQVPVLVKEIDLPSPGRIRKYGDGKLVTTSGKDIVTIDLATLKVEPLAKGVLKNPGGLGVDEAGNVYVGELEPLHQVFGFTPQGKQFVTFGKPGKRKVGPFDVDDLENPYGVEVGPDGRVWVMEHTDWPKRVSLWDPATAKCSKAIYGPTQYGGDGSMDPEDNTRLFYKGLEFRRDEATGEISLVNLTYRGDNDDIAHFNYKDANESGNYPAYAFRTESRNAEKRKRGETDLWFTSFMYPHGHPTLVLWHYADNIVKPAAAMGAACSLRTTFGEEHVPISVPNAAWTSTAFLTNHIPGYDPDQRFFTWTDMNEDGKIQVEELAFGKLEMGDKLLAGADAAWNWRMNHSFQAAANARNGGIVLFTPKGFTPRGYPMYDVPEAPLPWVEYGQALMPDSAGDVISLSGPMSCISPEGKVVWTYRNDWPGLHAGHHTTARGDEPGVLIAPTRIWGIVPTTEEVGEVVAFNSNLGCTYLMTTRDGLYIDRVFRDQRVGLLWNMPEPPTPEVMAETSTYDEHFGGVLQVSRDADGKEHYYYVLGKNHCSVVELTGLKDIKRLAGGAVAVAPQSIVDAQERRQAEMLRTAQPKDYAVRRVPGLREDGYPADWKDVERIAGFALLYDDANLYLNYQGQGAFQNNGENPVMLFKTGDAVDLMLQTRPGLPAGRMEAGEGDLRLSFSMFEGEPVAILYDFKVPGFTGNPVPFGSPVRTIWCDAVAPIADAKMTVRRDRNAFTLEATVPLKAIHLDPVALRETRGDVGRVYADGKTISPELFYKNIAEILKLVSKCAKKIIILEPFLLPTIQEKENLREGLNAKIAAVRQCAALYKTDYIPLDGIFAELSIKRGAAFYSPDGVHLTDEGNAAVAGEWLNRTEL